MALAYPSHPQRKRKLRVDRALQLRQSATDQVIPDVPRAGIVAIRAPFRAELHRLARDFDFGQTRGLRDALDDVPVSIAGAEVHPRIDVRRILAQLLVDDAYR